MYYVYIIRSVNLGKWYIGSSDNPERRLKEHNRGIVRSTRPFIPYKIIHTEEYETKLNAQRRENQIKKSGVIRKKLRNQYVALSSSG